MCVLLQQECEDTQVKLQSPSQVPELGERGLTRDERFHRGQSGLQVVSSSGRALLPSLLETLSLCHAICCVYVRIKEDREEYDKCPVCSESSLELAM